MINATHQNGSEQSSERVNPEGASYVSRRPSWAETTRIDPEAIIHGWTAPTTAVDQEGVSVIIELCREDGLFVHDEGVFFDPGETRILLLDTWLDVDNARLLAKGILECCNRFEDTTHEAASETER